MRDLNVYGIRRALPRMSWHPKNLYNLWRRSTVKKDEAVFTNTSQTLFQQRWIAKRLTRAYHGDFINEKIFKRWYLPDNLPDVRPRKRVIGDDTEALAKFAAQDKRANSERNKKEEEDFKALAPVGSLMFAEVERRIDVFIFRCCFAHSVYEARRMVIHGSVLLNGKKHQNANTRLAPGDMVSVDPAAIRFLQPKIDASKESESAEQEAKEEEASDTKNEASSSPPPVPSAPKKWSLEKPPLTPFNLPPYASPFIFIPAYIEVSFPTCSAIFVRLPTARPGYSEIPTPYEADGEIMRLSWEWYGRVRPRMRSKSQMARMPENRQESRIIPLPALKPPRPRKQTRTRVL